MKYRIDDVLYYRQPDKKLRPYSWVPLIVLGRGRIEFKDGARNVYVVKYRHNNKWTQAVLGENELFIKKDKK